jgi:hypothetical protein
VTKDLVNDGGAREAVLGLKKKPVFKVSKIFEEYESETKDQVLISRPINSGFGATPESEWSRASQALSAIS